MTSDRKKTAVRVDGLTKRFEAFTAVDQVSFQVREGEIFGFLGPNGAGKTTVIKMLSGLLRPTSGAGTVSGFDLLTETEAIKRHIGYMSQLFSLYEDLTVEENIAFFSGLYGVEKAKKLRRRDWVLETAGLTAHRDRLTRTLPLGFKQRLALGCAVLHEPPILFLDEPTSGVDPLSRRRFWDLIHSLSDQGVTVFVSTHYMEEAEYCHRLSLMNRGRLIALDSPSGLRGMMGLPLLELNVQDSLGAVEALQGQPGVTAVALFGRTLHVTVNDAAEAQDSIPVLLRSRGIAVTKLSPIPPSLEDVFVHLVAAQPEAATA